MEMRERCRRQGVEFLVATFPNGLGYAMKSDLSGRFHDQLRAAGVDVVEVGQRFRDLGLTPKDLAIDRTGHLGPRGHALATEVLEGEIKSLAARRRQARYSR
jgi:hypothetical protein